MYLTPPLGAGARASCNELLADTPAVIEVLLAQSVKPNTADEVHLHGHPPTLQICRCCGYRMSGAIELRLVFPLTLHIYCTLYLLGHIMELPLTAAVRTWDKTARPGDGHGDLLAEHPCVHAALPLHAKHTFSGNFYVLNTNSFQVLWLTGRQFYLSVSVWYIRLHYYKLLVGS
jgi:hypothetical protein